MSTLSTNTAGELLLTLRGENEDRILTTVRRWPHWQRVVVERDPEDSRRCLSVTLVTDVAFEAVVREILRRSFNLIFPDAGGSVELALPEPPARGRKRWYR